ncbi:hypothetical protein OAC86_00655 [bacterium]|nr:hypothetical protein [bacterium]
MANFNPLKAFGSVFEKIGASADDQKSIAESASIMAVSVSVGGTLINKLDELIDAVRELGGTAKKPDFKELAAAGGGGFSMMDSLALAFLAPTLKPLGKGMGFIIDTINNLDEGGKEKAEALEAIFGTLSNLAAVGKSIFGFAFWIALSLPFLMMAMLAAPLLAITMRLTIMAINFGTKKLDEEQMEKVAMLGDVGMSIFKFAGLLALTSFIMPWALKGAMGAAILILGVGMVFKFLDFLGITEDIEQTAKGLAMAGLAILSIGVALALFSLIEPYAMKGFKSAMLMIAGIGFVLAIISGGDGDFEKAAKGLSWAALGIITLGLALWFFNWLDPSVGTFFKVLAFVTGFAIAFALIGNGADEIKEAAQALLWASLSIIVIALSFQLMNYILGDSLSDPANFAGLLLVAGLAAGYAVIGLGASLIKEGAIGMILVGASLITVAIGMAIMDAALKRNGWELIGQTGALIAGLGLAMAAAGAGALFIALGAGAMILAGVALIIIATGTAIMAAVFKSSGINKMMAKTGDFDTGLEALMFAVKNSFNFWPWEAFGVATGAGAMVIAGVALISIGAGLTLFANIAEKLDLPKLAENIAFMIGTLSIPFEKIGAGGILTVKDPLGGKDQKIKFAGGDFWSGGNPVKKGIDSVLNMGTALTNIAVGVQNMANLKFPTGFDKEGKPTAYETIGGDAFKAVITNTMMMVGALAIPFAKIGQGGKQMVLMPDGNEMEVDFGAPSFGIGFLTIESDVSKGVKSVMGFGSALSNLALGVQSMAMLKMPTSWDPETGKANAFEAFNTDSAQAVTDNTMMLVGALTGTFATVGKNPNAETGFWGGKSTIQKGVDLVAGFGKPLVNLAKGVQDMSNLRFASRWDKDGKAVEWYEMKDMGIVTENVKTNTRKLVQALTSVFETIGGGKSKESGWWEGETKFEKGMAIVKMIAEPYAKLGSSVKNISEAVNKYDVTETVAKVKQFIGVFTGAGIGEDTALLNYKKLLVNAIGHSFEKLAAAIPAIVSATGSYDSEKGKAFANMFIGPVDAKQPNASYSHQKLLWNAIGHSMTQTGESMPKVAEGINAIDFEKLVETRKMFEALGVLSNGGEPSDILAAMGQSLEEALQNLADMLSQFQTTVSEGNEAQTGVLDGIKGAVSGVSKSLGIGGKGSSAADTPAAAGETGVVRAIQNLQSSLEGMVSSGQLGQ